MSHRMPDLHQQGFISFQKGLIGSGLTICALLGMYNAFIEQTNLSLWGVVGGVAFSSLNVSVYRFAFITLVRKSRISALVAFLFLVKVPAVLLFLYWLYRLDPMLLYSGVLGFMALVPASLFVSLTWFRQERNEQLDGADVAPNT